MIKGIRAVRIERAWLGASLPRITIAYTLLHDNAEELLPLVSEVREAGADSVFVSRLNYATLEMGHSNERGFQAILDIESRS